MSRPKKAEMDELLEKNYGIKSIKEIVMDVTLPPPVYGKHLTTKRERSDDAANLQIKLVASITREADLYVVESLTGEKYYIPQFQVKWFRYD